jgi:F-type H+-transporting ATPase subunit g
MLTVDSTMQTVQTYLQPVTKAIQNPSAFINRAPAPKDPQSFLNRLREMDSATLKQVGIVTAEVIGFFSVGEMLGRFKIIGYRSEAVHAH